MTLFLLEITNTILSSTDIVFHIVYKHEKTYSLVGEWGGACASVCIHMERVCIYISGQSDKTAPRVRTSLHLMHF